MVQGRTEGRWSPDAYRFMTTRDPGLTLALPVHRNGQFLGVIALDVMLDDLTGKAWRVQPTPVLVVTFWSLVLSLVVCGAVSAIFERDQWVRAPNGAEWGAIAYNSIVIFGFSQFMWFRLASILPPLASSLSVMLIPVIGLFSGMAMLGERPHWQDFAALAAILVAMATVLVPKAPARA